MQMMCYIFQTNIRRCNINIHFFLHFAYCGGKRILSGLNMTTRKQKHSGKCFFCGASSEHEHFILACDSNINGKYQ